jgi:hypothetical protein
MDIDKNDTRGFFKNKFLRLQKSLRLGAKMNGAPPLRRRKLAPRHELGTYASFKKLASGAYHTNSYKYL